MAWSKTMVARKKRLKMIRRGMAKAEEGRWEIGRDVSGGGLEEV